MIQKTDFFISKTKLISSNEPTLTRYIIFNTDLWLDHFTKYNLKLKRKFNYDFMCKYGNYIACFNE